ncbi:MAG: OmpA family protein [Maritimibacter sp.]|jgi:outer membrane protein OmpA-like peptidoglycan-associated protein
MSRAYNLILAAVLCAAPQVGWSLSLDLPTGADLRIEKVLPAGSYDMPTGPWQTDTGVAAERLSGSVTKQAWRIGGTGLTSDQIFLELRDQITAAGYEIGFECDAASCGGFDFRYGTEVIGEPEMHVDLGNYQFLSAEKPGEDQDALSLLVSRSPSAGFVQIIQVGARAALPIEPVTSTSAQPGTVLPDVMSGEIGTAMEEVGRYVLSDLTFETGSSNLGPGDFDTLKELATYLSTHPEKRVALVGHTDAEGSLSGNVALSKRRAESVMARLMSDFAIPRSQLEADGVGYLSPLASNQTEDGRMKNRRVEAILISTE